MNRKRKQEKFHESLINMLYAPPSPLPDQNNQFDDQTLTLAREIVKSNHHPINTDELKEEEEEDHDDDEGELGGFEKLTRAQRKRLRKKKLKEAASHRREIIGPQLPGDGDDDQRQSEGVRRNAAEGAESGNECEHRGETPSCIKVKHRRISKKKAMEKQKAYPTDLSHDTTHPAADNS